MLRVNSEIKCTSSNSNGEKHRMEKSLPKVSSELKSLTNFEPVNYLSTLFG